MKIETNNRARICVRGSVQEKNNSRESENSNTVHLEMGVSVKHQ